jgi:hypothetical protein
MVFDISTNSSAMLHFGLQSRLCICLAFQERNAGPTSAAMTPGDQHDVFHLLNSHSKSSGEGEPVVDVPHHPLTKISP